MTARRTYVLVVDGEGRANAQQLRAWLREGWVICAVESRAHGPAIAVAITVERDGDPTVQKRWRAKQASRRGRGLPH